MLKNTKTCILVLDIDGTLTDSVAMHQEAFVQALRMLDIPQLDTNWDSYQQHTDTGILAEAVARADLPKKSPQQVSAFEADLTERFLRSLRSNALREIRGARKLTEYAVQSKWGVVYATGGVRGVSRAKLEAVGIPYSEETLITSSEYENRTELVASAIQRAKEVYRVSEPIRILSLGDGRWDLEVATALNIDFLGIGAGTRSAAFLANSGAEVLPDLSAACDRLERYNP